MLFFILIFKSVLRFFIINYYFLFNIYYILILVMIIFIIFREFKILINFENKRYILKIFKNLFIEVFKLLENYVERMY